MYALGSLLVSLAKILSMLITVYQYVILGAIVVSWVRADPYNPIVRFLRQVTEPVFAQVRRLLPRFLFRTGLDFSPLIVLLSLTLLNNFAVGLLYHYGRKWMVSSGNFP